MINNQKGITLVELLAALTLSIVIFGLIFGAFQMGIKSYHRGLDAGDLQTDADLVVTSLSNQFYKERCTPFGDGTVNDVQTYLTDNQISNPSINYTGSITCKDGLLTIDLVADYKKLRNEIHTKIYYPWGVTSP